MDYVLFFLGVIWYTLGAVVICGLAVSFCRKLFVSMLGGGFGRGVVIATSIVGTPVHELGHAVMCLLFGHTIIAMSLWQPRSPDGNLGYVTHTYRKRNLYHILGNLFIGIGPILSGLAVLSLALWLGFPTTCTEYFSAATHMAAQGEGEAALVLEGLKILPRMVGEMTDGSRIPLWGQILALLVIFSVAQHISLSPADIKLAYRAIPLYLALALILTVICSLIGPTAMGAVTGALARFSAYLTVLFVVVLVCSLIQLVVAVPFWLLRGLRKA
jgi:hypothetical protein